MKSATTSGASCLDRSAPQPLWRQLLADLTRRLDAGEFAASFPGELALRDEYAVSRHTVREALRQLREAGTVTAERGRVPRVAMPSEIEQPLGALYSLFASVEAAGLEQRSVVRILDVRADGVVADRLGLDGGVPLVHLERLRLAAGEPLAVDRVWLPAALAAALLEADFSHTSLYGQLAQRCSIRLTGGSETLQAINPTPFERHLLDIGEGVAAFSIQRLGCVDGTPIEYRHTVIRGDRFRLIAQFSARSGYQLDLTAHQLTPASLGQSNWSN